MRLTDIARAVLERVDPPRDIEDYKEKIKTLLDLEQYTKTDPELMQAIKQAYQVLAKWKIQEFWLHRSAPLPEEARAVHARHSP